MLARDRYSFLFTGIFTFPVWKTDSGGPSQALLEIREKPPPKEGDEGHQEEEINRESLQGIHECELL